MSQSKNPYIEPENYFSGYEESMKEIEKLQGHVELDRLCYEVLGVSESAKKLMEILKDRFICAPTPVKINAHYETACVYYEGWRAALRYLHTLVESYKQRKDFEAKEAEKSYTEKGV